MNYALKPLTLTDLVWLMELRNECRTSFINTSSFTIDQQMNWFENLSPNHHYFIVWDEKLHKRAGTFNIVPLDSRLPIPSNSNPTAYVGGYMVHPDYRGQGVMEATNAGLDPAQQYIGYIRYENWPSLRACLRIGWRAVEAHNHPDFGKLIVVLWGSL